MKCLLVSLLALASTIAGAEPVQVAVSANFSSPLKQLVQRYHQQYPRADIQITVGPDSPGGALRYFPGCRCSAAAGACFRRVDSGWHSAHLCHWQAGAMVSGCRSRSRWLLTGGRHGDPRGHGQCPYRTLWRSRRGSAATISTSGFGDPGTGRECGAELSLCPYWRRRGCLCGVKPGPGPGRATVAC
jgi:hypothetical protein